ncbi:MAG TPA: alpha-hydroxy acid oxidase [Burkholderiales bacterium]|nr:alpha-hydroxy acid oxidase [Burkholderiales bacterium]
MKIANIDDLRTLAFRKLPRVLFDYIDGGAQDETTLRANMQDFGRWNIVQHVLRDVTQRDHSVTVLGQKLDLPLILSPTGMTGIFWPNGALEASRAAKEAGAGFCLSSMSTSTVEDIREATQRPFWFQLYVMRDRGLSRELIERAKAAGCSALVLTVDLAMQGQRDRDVHNGLTVPPKLRPSNMMNFAMRPGWVWRYLTGPKVVPASLVKPGQDTLLTISTFVNSQFDQSVSWKDIEWAKSIWGGPVALKGILDPDDAKAAVDHGADALIVSNHGGRQLDGVRSAISALPGVVDAVRDRAEVLLDGGVRRGTDVFKAIALGAKACMIGRPYMYGLAGKGRAGVAQALQLLRNEIDLALVLSGNVKLSALQRSAILSSLPADA